MSLAELSVENLRCLEHVSLDLHPGHNLIWGANASGKTSLLEAIFLLGRGRSFRTRNSERLIRFGAENLVTVGRTDGLIPQTLGLQVSRHQGTIAKIGGAFVQSLAELSRCFAVQIIEPGVHRLVEEGGHRRRRWLDWGVFHVEPSYIDTWSAYMRAVKQRNAALRTHAAGVAAWDPEVARLGEIVGQFRRTFIERLQPYWFEATVGLLGTKLELSYTPGWPSSLSLLQTLLATRERDEARGMTQAGAHRGDVALRIGGKPARDVLSRGEQKLVAIAMTLAQLRLIHDASGISPTILLDDPAAELDRTRLAGFAAQIQALPCQLVVTALGAELDPLGVPDRVFHVERGRVLHV